MVRSWCVVLGIGLVLLGLAGLGAGAVGNNWMSWLDFVAAAVSFVVAGIFRPEVTVSLRRMSGPGLIAAGLFVMWIFGIATRSVGPAMAWWNFIFGCAYALLAVSSRRARPLVERRTSMTEELMDRERFDRDRHQRAA
jgi:hypothetical protein